jgi:anti-sigma B factor antagonist
MNSTTRTVGTVTVIELVGELEVSEAPHLRDLLGEAVAGSQSRVLLDLGQVTFIDSSGIGVLVGAHRRADEAGARLGLAAAGAGVRRVFELTRTDRVLRLFETVEEGVTALGA